MKKLLILLFLATTLYGYGQGSKNIFSRDPIINLENFQKKDIYFGFYLGFNSYDFKIDYKENKYFNDKAEDVLVNKTIGFNVGIIADLRLQEYINLRFEPGLYYTKRDLLYPQSEFTGTTEPYNATNKFREVNSTYIHFPLLLKLSSVRTGNIRPYLLAGLSATLNLSSNAKLIDDNFQQKFRVKTWTPNYELGLGIDIFSEYFIFSPSIRGVFSLKDELIRDNDSNGISPWTSNLDSMKSRAVFINFSFH